MVSSGSNEDSYDFYNSDYFSQGRNTDCFQRLCDTKDNEQEYPIHDRKTGRCKHLSLLNAVVCFVFAALVTSYILYLTETERSSETKNYSFELVTDANKNISVSQNLTVFVKDNRNITENGSFLLAGIDKPHDQPTMRYIENNSVIQYLNDSVSRVKRNASVKNIEFDDFKKDTIDSFFINSSYKCDFESESKINKSNIITDENNLRTLNMKTGNDTYLQLESHNVSSHDLFKEAQTPEREVKQIQDPAQKSLTTDLTSFAELIELGSLKEYKKRSPYDEEVSNRLILRDNSDTLYKYRHAMTLPNTKLPTKNKNTQYSKETSTYPPTGPDGSNFAESMKTSQQLTVANNQIYKPVCFTPRNTGIQSPSSYVCTSMPIDQFNYLPGLNSDQQFSKGRELSFPTIMGSSGGSDLSTNLVQNPIIVTPTNSPNIHIPTAISSPNPYFFPTFNGAPMFTNVASQIQLTSPTWSSRVAFPSPLSMPPVQSFVPLEYGPQYIVHGSQSGFPRVMPQPYAQAMPYQQHNEFQNPVFCMYVPTQSHQFPVVNGVTEFRSTIVENTSDYKSFLNQARASKGDEKRCASDEFACANSDSCIPLSAWCDGRVDCRDASDETACSCRHRVDKDRLCDGFFDCPSGEDELGCFGCDADSFSCQDWQRGRDVSKCVSLAKRCDNVIDCSNQKDEKECALLAENVAPHKTHFVSYTSGLLHRNWQGRWYPACTGAVVTEWARQACLSEVGILTSEPHIKMVTTEYPGPFIIPNSPDKYTLSHMCQNQKVVTHVTCPAVPCGTRLTRSLNSPPSPPRLHLYQTSSGRGSEVSVDNYQYKTSDFKNKPVRPYYLPYASDLEPLNERKSSGIYSDEDFYMFHFNNQDENKPCQTCNSHQSAGENLNQNILLAGKSEKYTTQYEPSVVYDYLEKNDEQRWIRDSSKVVGGRESLPGSWPWLVAVYEDGSFHCGGVILNELWVMSAAHCVENFPMHYYEVQAGMLRRFSFSPQEQTRPVTHIILHSLYNRVKMHNDLALLRLKHQLKYNRWVRPICLPEEHITEFGPSPGTFCTAVGWGATEEHGPDPDHLHEVNVPILPYCKHKVDQEGVEICAGYITGGHDTCQGDSGGPLLCRLSEERDMWYVAGVVSHGEGCARPDEPGVYTRVYLFMDWIKSIINEQVSILTFRQRPLQECPSQHCGLGHRCIPFAKLCDTQVDCLNAQDETSCLDNYLGYTESYQTPMDSKCSYSDNDTFCDLNDKHTPDKKSYYELNNMKGDAAIIKQSVKFDEREQFKLQGRNSNFEILNVTINQQVQNTTEDGYYITDHSNYPDNKASIFTNDVEDNAFHSTPMSQAVEFDESTESYYSDINSPTNAGSEITTFKPIVDVISNADSSGNIEQQQGEANKNNTLLNNVRTNGVYHEKISNETQNYSINSTFFKNDSQKSVSSLNKPEDVVFDVNHNYTNFEYSVETSNQSQSKSQNDENTTEFPQPQNNENTTEFPQHLNNEQTTDFRQSQNNEHTTESAQSEINENMTEAQQSQNDENTIEFPQSQNSKNTTEFQYSHNHSVLIVIPDANKKRLDASLNNNEHSFSKPAFMENKNATYVIKNSSENQINYNINELEYTDSEKGEENEFNENYCRHFTSNFDYGNKNLSKKNMSRTTSQLKQDHLFICKKYHQPLLRRRRCDGFIDCEDGSDEMDCSCREKLQHFHPDLICDGQIHCFDHSDECNCERKCKKNEFYCPRSKICVSRMLHCNGIFDCPKGDDEENCYALVKGESLVMDESHLPMFNEDGFLAVYKRGQWQIQCSSSSNLLGLAFTACSSLGFQAYENFHMEMINKSVYSPNHSETNAVLCPGLRVKCAGWREGAPWLGLLYVEGELLASAAVVNKNWVISQASICHTLNLETEYIEIQLGQSTVSTPVIKGLYEQTRRIDKIIAIENSGMCLLHTESPIQFNKLIRSIDIPSDEADGEPHLFAFVLTDKGLQRINLTKTSNDNCNINKICFTVLKPPSICYLQNLVSENGFVVMETSYKTKVVATFPSYTIFCENTDLVCLQSSIKFATPILQVIKNYSHQSNSAPPCNGVRCGKCVSWTKVSDGTFDCINHFDESLNSTFDKQRACQDSSNTCGCGIDQLRCHNRQCVDKSQFCDGVHHCRDGSDEPADCKNNCLQYLQLTAPQKLCDGVRNCFDKSDETWETCHESTCSLPNSFKCKSSEKCIPQEFVCDSEKDCPNGDDEKNCVAIQTTHSKGTEGLLLQQKFGVWAPKCVNKFSLNVIKVCNKMGFSTVVHQELIMSNRSTIIAPDSFSPVKLNNNNKVELRRGRPMLEMNVNKNCTHLYISCK